MGAVLRAVPEQSSSVCCAASDHHGSSFPVPFSDCLSSRFSFSALSAVGSSSPGSLRTTVQPEECAALHSCWEQIGLVVGWFCCFFLTKEKYKSFFLCESVKFLPESAALRPPSLCYFLFILRCGFPFCLSSCQRWREAALSGDKNFSPWTPLCPPSPGIQVPLWEAAAGRTFAVAW